MSSNHFRPAQAPPPFPPPILLSARRVIGTVLTEIPDDMEAAPRLERRSSVAGNILIVESEVDSKDKISAFLLQRTVKDTLFGGPVRVGFVLYDPTGSQMGLWELTPSTINGSEPFQMVAVKIEEKSALAPGDGEASPQRLAELSALQWITSNDPEGSGHLLGPTVLAEDGSHIYIITPFFKEGTLYDFIEAEKRLTEAEIRFVFKQILNGLDDLKRLQICHRNLSLEAVLLQGTKFIFAQLGNALRIPCEDDMPCLIEPQNPCGIYPQYVAPELINTEPFDGYAVDLWSAGVMLFVMLLGMDVLFATPLPDDATYKEICIVGNLKDAVKRCRSEDLPEVSDDALDLLQKMLRASPRDRLTLEGVRAHPWVTAGEVVPLDKLKDFRSILEASR